MEGSPPAPLLLPSNTKCKENAVNGLRSVLASQCIDSLPMCVQQHQLSVGPADSCHTRLSSWKNNFRMNLEQIWIKLLSWEPHAWESEELDGLCNQASEQKVQHEEGGRLRSCRPKVRDNGRGVLNELLQLVDDSARNQRCQKDRKELHFPEIIYY